MRKLAGLFLIAAACRAEAPISAKASALDPDGFTRLEAPGALDRRPLHACPVELRKMRAAIHFDPLERYRRLRDFCDDAGLEEEARWLRTRIARLEG